MDRIRLLKKLIVLYQKLLIILKSKNKKFYVIHHSGTSRDFTGDRAISKWTFYNKIIKADGTIVNVHDRWHDRGNGYQSKDYCVLGNYEEEELNQEGISSLKTLLMGIDRSKVIGHREIKKQGFTKGTMATLCPGRCLMEWLKAYRSS